MTTNLQAKILDEPRYKNLQYNACKLYIGIYKKDHPLSSS